MQPILCYVHIPKTAGSSIEQAARNAVGSDRVHWIGSPDTLTAWQGMTENEFARLAVIGGHVPAVDFERIERPKIFASMVRDPVRRAISLYRYIADWDGTHPLHKEIAGLSILEAIEASPGFVRDISDQQSSNISGETDTVAFLRDRDDWIIGPVDAERLFARLARCFNWPMSPMERIKAAPDGYDRPLMSPEVSARITALNPRDVDLFRWVSALTPAL